MTVSLKRYDRNDYDYSASPDQNLAPHKKAKIGDSPSPEQSLAPSKKAKKEYRFALEKFPPYIIGSILSYADPKCLGVLRQADSSYRNINYQNPVAPVAPKALVDASTNCNLIEIEENAIKNIRGNTRNILNSKYIKMGLNRDAVSRATHDLIALKMLQKACQKYASNLSEVRHRIEHFYRHLDGVSGFDRTHAFLNHTISILKAIDPALVSKIMDTRARFAERRPSLRMLSSNVNVMQNVVDYTDLKDYRALMQVFPFNRAKIQPPLTIVERFHSCFEQPEPILVDQALLNFMQQLFEKEDPDTCIEGVNFFFNTMMSFNPVNTWEYIENKTTQLLISHDPILGVRLLLARCAVDRAEADWLYDSIKCLIDRNRIKDFHHVCSFFSSEMPELFFDTYLLAARDCIKDEDAELCQQMLVKMKILLYNDSRGYESVIQSIEEIEEELEEI